MFEQEFRDNWMDNIDWVKVKRTERGVDDASSSDDEAQSIDRADITRKVIELMKPGETVAKVRLAASSPATYSALTQSLPGSIPSQHSYGWVGAVH